MQRMVGFVVIASGIEASGTIRSANIKIIF